MSQRNKRTDFEKKFINYFGSFKIKKIFTFRILFYLKLTTFYDFKIIGK